MRFSAFVWARAALRAAAEANSTATKNAEFHKCFLSVCARPGSTNAIRIRAQTKGGETEVKQLPKATKTNSQKASCLYRKLKSENIGDKGRRE
jgi:hypothetical protein